MKRRTLATTILLLLLPVCASGNLDIENFDSVSDIDGGQGVTNISLNTNATYIQEGASARIVINPAVSVNGNIQDKGFNDDQDMGAADSWRIWVYYDQPQRVGVGATVRMFSGKNSGATDQGVLYNFSFTPAQPGWTLYESRFADYNLILEGDGNLDLTDIDAWAFEVDGVTGSGDFVFYVDELEAFTDPQTDSQTDMLVLEDFDDIGDVSPSQGGGISLNTIPLYINSGSSCRVADSDNGNVTIQSTSFDLNDDLSGYSTFVMSVFFPEASRIAQAGDAVVLWLFSDDGLGGFHYNRWLFPVPAADGWVTYAGDLSGFSDHDGSGAIDLTNVDAWRFDVNGITGIGDFVFYVDDLLILPPKTHETPEHWIYRNSDLIARINKSDGLLEQLTTISGIPRTVLPLTPRGLDLRVENVTQGWSGSTVGLAGSSTSTGNQPGQEYNRIECQYVLDNANGLDSLMAVTGQYTFYDDRMDANFVVSYLQSSADHFEITLGQNYEPSAWQTELYPGSAWHLEYDTTGPIPNSAGEVILQYADALDQHYDFRSWNPAYAIGGHGPQAMLPYGILQNGDTFFLWGYRDLGRFVVLAPRRHGKIPSFLTSPLNLTAGDSYRFDFSYKSFSKPRNTFTDVARWYAEKMYSTHPASAGLVTRPKDLPHRTIHPGNLATPALYTYSRLSANYSDFEDMRDELGRNLKMTNVWGAYWVDDEIYRTTGILDPSNGHLTTPQELRAYFDYLRGAGYKSYLYFRQFLYTTFANQPPYDSWKALAEDGMAFEFAFGPVPPTKLSHQFADFTNPDFRNWYIAAVKDCVSYYGVDAVAWDMGWLDGYTGYTVTNPPLEGNGIHHGLLAVQAEIYDWIQANYPDKKVTINLSGYSPCGLYADGVMFEGGEVRQRDVEAIKAFNVDIINLTYADNYKNGPPEVHIRSIMRALGRGATWASTTLELFEHPDPADPVHNRGLGLYLNDLEVLADYSALANSLHLMTESYAVISSNPSIYANAWADPNHLTIAVYNDTGSPAGFSLDMNRAILAKYGQSGSQPMTAIRFNSFGLPVTTAVSLTKSFTADNCVRFEGNFAENELVVIVDDTLENQRFPDHISLSSGQMELEPGNNALINVEVVDAFGRRFANSDNVTITVSESTNIIADTLVGSTGDNKSVSGTTNDQGFATVTITNNVEETVSLNITSTTLPATQPHQEMAVDFRYPTEKLIDGFSRLSIYGQANAVTSVDQTSLNLKEGKVSLELILDPLFSSQGLLQNNTPIPLDLSDFENGRISWWMYCEDPDGLSRIRFRAFDDLWANWEGVDIFGPFDSNVLIGDLNSDGIVDWADLRLLVDNWLNSACLTPDCGNLNVISGVDYSDYSLLADNWKKMNEGWIYYEFQLPFSLNGGTPVDWSNFGHYKFEFYGVNGDPFTVLIDNLRVRR